MAQITYTNPPLAGRPPFATDEPDSIYEQRDQYQPALRQPKEPHADARSSAYNHYDAYLDGDNRQSGVGALGMGLMNGDMDDDDDDDDDFRQGKNAALAAATNNRQQQQQQMPLAAPRPGYAAPIAALNLSRPPASASPEGRQPTQSTAQLPAALRPAGSNSSGMSGAIRAPPPAAMMRPIPAPISVPSTPHPLPPTMTPITPFFARPAKVEQQRDVRWGPKPIMRSDSEETLIPKSRPGGKGDDFWRRFSMIAKEENQKPSSQKQSVWLRKNMDGTTRLSRWVWIVTVLLLVCIGLAIGLGWYASHTHPNTPHSAPKTFGGSANEHGAVAEAPDATDADGSTSHHVSPTNTVARRYDIPDPVPTFGAFNIVLPHASSGLDGVHRAASNRRHRRHAHLNRTTY